MNIKWDKRIFMMLGAVSLAACLTIGLGAGEAYAKKKVLPKKITASGNMLDKSKLNLEPGDREKIEYTIRPKKTTNKKVVFSSSNKKVATVTAKGVVRGIKEGKATVTIRAKAKKTVKAKIKVTVEKVQSSPGQVKTYQAPNFAPADGGMIQDALDTFLASGNTVTGITLDRTTIELAAGESDKLTASIVPVTSTEKIVWTIDYLGGINIYQNGNIFVTEDTPVGTTAVITATCGRVSASCTVRVVNGPCEHVWGAWQETTPATCLTEGIRQATCEKCGKQREEPTSATGHSWLGKTITTPTCTEVGEMEYTCQNCNETRTEIIKANGHTWSVSGEIVEEPNCTKKGKMKYKCMVAGCDGEKTEDIEALGHTWDAGEVTKSPTCTGNGTRTYHCVIDGCTGTKKEQIEPTGHTWTYGEITQEPGCIATGKRVSTCLNCLMKNTVTLPATGHDWDNGTVTKEPSCVQQGIRTFTCKTCQNTKDTAIVPLGHDLGDYQVDKEPTCTQVGMRSKHCKRTGCTYRTDIQNVPKLGHDYDDGVVATEPNCVDLGVEIFTCKRTGCDAQKREFLPSLGHDWTVDYVIDVEATCTLAGKKSIHCQRTGCDKTKNSRSVPPLGHDWDMDSVVEVEPTCTADGTNTYTCKRETIDADGNVGTCGMMMVEVVPALGHKFSNDWTLDQNPTCVEPGKKSKHCTNTYKNANGVTVKCTEVKDATVVEPIGHNWNFSDDVSWAETVAPLHGIPGLEVRTCTSCGAEQSRGKVAEHVLGEDGTCQNCSESVSLTKTTIKDWEYTVNEADKTVLLKKYIGTVENILIPAKLSVDVDGVVGIYDVKFAGGYTPIAQSGIFASNKKCKIKAVSFEDGVKVENMQYMFYGCDDLETVVHIPSTVTSMFGTFKNCTALKYVGKIPDGVTELSNTFENCSNLAVAPAIPANVTSLYAAFKNCKALSVAPELPEGVVDLDWTFSGCAELYEPPVLPTTVTEMTNTFESCISLTKVPEDIPEGVKKLTLTFYGCDSLETAPKMPSTVETMEYTFKNCKNLTYAAPLPKTVTRQVDVFVGCDRLVQ